MSYKRSGQMLGGVGGGGVVTPPPTMFVCKFVGNFGNLGNWSVSKFGKLINFLLLIGFCTVVKLEITDLKIDDHFFCFYFFIFCLAFLLSWHTICCKNKNML